MPFQEKTSEEDLSFNRLNNNTPYNDNRSHCSECDGCEPDFGEENCSNEGNLDYDEDAVGLYFMGDNSHVKMHMEEIINDIPYILVLQIHIEDKYFNAFVDGRFDFIFNGE